MVDTCVGNGKSITVVPAWDNLNTPFLDRLRALGTAPETVDYVLCTHLHVDHVGWQNVVGRPHLASDLPERSPSVLPPGVRILGIASSPCAAGAGGSRRRH